MRTIYFGEPNIGLEEIKAMTKVVQSKWIGLGKVSLEFEKKLAQYLGVKYAAVLDSCTAALHLSLILNRVKPGDEIITTSLTFAATSNVICYLGAKPVFVDIKQATLNIDEDLIEQAITKKTKGIVVVHFGGLPCNMDKINAIAKKHKLFVVEDAAHAIGAKLNGKMIGNSSNLTCFSFYANKNLTTNEGGLITSNNKDLINRVKVLRLHGLSKNAWSRYSNKKFISVEVVDLGYKYNITDMQSAMGLIQLKKLTKSNVIRQKYAQMYDQAFSKINGVSLQNKLNNPKVNHALHLYTIVIDPNKFKINRDQIVLALRNRGIYAVVHYKPLHLHHYYKKHFHYKRGDLKVTKRVGDNIFTLPLLPQLSLREAQRIIKTTEQVLLKSHR